MALMLAQIALGVKKGDKVSCPALSFIATANSILHNGAEPVFFDISSRDGNIDMAKVKHKGEKAIIPVHLYGNMCDMDALAEYKRKNNVAIIEDAAEAHGAIYKGKKAGSFGDIGCFSFYSTKNMTVGGDGGMMTADNEETAKKLRKLTDCGRKTKYEHDVLGYTARLNTINAAIGIVQLKRLEEWNKARRGAAAAYSKNLPKEIQLQYKEGCAYYTYTIRLKDEKQRDMAAAHLEKEGIMTGVYFPIPMHLQPIYRERYGYKEGRYPVSEKFSKEILSLPLFVGIKDEQIKLICEKVNEAINQ